MTADERYMQLLTRDVSSSIGRACVLAFTREGAAGVAALNIQRETAERTAEESKSIATNEELRVLAHEVDVTKAAEVETMMAHVYGESGRVNYAVNCAGIIGPLGPVAATSLDAFAKVMDVNVNGVLNSMQGEIRHMSAQEARASKINPKHSSRGSIVNTASIASVLATPNWGAYTTSKHAVLGLTRCAGNSGSAKDKIRINAICAGYVETPLIGASAASIAAARDDEAAQQRLQKLRDAAAMARMAEPKEIVEVLLFLCSEKVSFVTGAAWRVDGGLLRG